VRIWIFSFFDAENNKITTITTLVIRISYRAAIGIPGDGTGTGTRIFRDGF
jgi:hypothetical protein